MNKTLNNIKAAAISLAALFLFSFSMSAKKTAKTRSFTTPDFAFPETVINNALPKLSPTTSDTDAVKALIQLTIARNIKDIQTSTETVNLIDSVATARKGAVSAILYNLEAQILKEFMASDYDIRNRQLPLSEPYPDDMRQWSADMFRIRIYQLCHKSLSNVTTLKAQPINNWKSLLSGLTSEQAKLCPDLYSLLAMRSATILNGVSQDSPSAIPFLKSDSPHLSPAQRCKQYTSEILQSLTKHAKLLKSPTLLVEVLSQREYDTDKDRYTTLIEAYRHYNEDTDAATLLTSAADCLPSLEDEISPSEYADLKSQTRKELQNYIDRFPTSTHINAIRNSLTSLDANTIRISGKSSYRDDTPITLHVTGIKANDKYYLKLFRFTGSPRNVNDMERIMSTNYSQHIQTIRLTKGEESTDTISASLGTLPFGSYGIVLADKGGANRTGIIGKYDLLTFNISNITPIFLNDQAKTLNSGIYVVDNRTGAPIKDALIDFSYYTQVSKEKHYKATTDDAGFAQIPTEMQDRTLRCQISKGKDKCEYSSYISQRYSTTDNIRAEIYTDLGIYHPGDTLRFALLTYKSDADISRTITNRKLNVHLYDASGVKTDSIQLTTDSHGRANASFLLPAKGMNGSYRLAITDTETNKTIGNNWVSVADYVVPHFFVEATPSAKSYNPGDIVKIEGTAQTYSGMPVNDADVKITIDFRPLIPWRYLRATADNFSVDLKTDAQGKFHIELPTENLSKKYTDGIFTIKAAVTSSAGETQQSTIAAFSLGAKGAIEPQMPNILKADSDTIRFTAIYKSADGTPKPELLHYILKDKETSRTIIEGEFTTPALEISSKRISSGTYKWELSKPDTNVNASTEITIYRDTDTKPARKTALWCPETEITASENAQEVNITIGSAYPDSYILCNISDKNGTFQTDWLKADAQNIPLILPVPGDNNRIFATLTTVRNGEIFQQTIVVQSAAEAAKLQCKTITFRDKIIPSNRETWQFKYSIGKNDAAMIPAFATMTDKALNSIQPFAWNVISPYNYYSSIRIDGNRIYDNFNEWDICGKMLPDKPSITFPGINTYGYALVKGVFYDECFVSIEEVQFASPRAAGANIVKKNVSMKQAAVTDAVMENSAQEFENETSVKQENYRPSECPIAFFMPDLLSDTEGLLEFGFTAPDYNTTWQLQLMAYSPNLKSNLTTLQTIASKPVMVTSQLPRFLRTGDTTTLAFTAYNNTAEEAPIAMHISIYDPLTGNELISADYAPQSAAPTASLVHTLEFIAPSDITSIGVRVTASLSGNSDGEQSLIGILPSSTPITESYPFYLSPDESLKVITCPETKEDSQTIFTYCDNPIWYCVTALPDMTFPTDASILSTLRHLYGNTIAAGLCKKYPQLQQAIKLWSDTQDNTLISPLQRDAEIKITELGNTPWALDAQAETQRMQRLTNLLNKETNIRAINEAIAEIMRRQKSSGAWSWCEGMQPSAYITSRVLLYFSMLKQLGYLPESKDIQQMTAKAVKYSDNLLYTDYLNNKKQFSTITLLNYLYVRSAFDNVNLSREFTSLKAQALKAISKEWEEFDIYDAAVAAILLHREGYPMKARTILESLRQRAISDPERGMHFENLSTSWNGRNALITTMQVLQAYAEIQPEAPQIDMLRQWLILERQVQDWGTADETAEIINTILTTGSDWTSDNTPADILLNGKHLEIPKRDMLTGYFTMPISGVKAAELQISKSASHPAWGGILTQHIAPITNVQEFSESDIQICKRILLIREDSTGIHTEVVNKGEQLEVGQKIRVELTLKSKRNMDYVTITDSRSAALSPIEQLSGYDFRSELPYYRDVQNEVTNLYLDFLPKGVNILHYDCYVTQAGQYSCGIATAQSLHAPLQTAHSAGSILTASPKP